MHEFVDHVADLEVRVAAVTLDGVFAEAGAALFEIITGDLGQIRPLATRSFQVAGGPPPDMLHDWLSTLHAAFEIDRMLLCHFHVRHTHGRLHATVDGERYDADRHLLAHEVKAVTRHLLAVQATSTGWEATFVVDV
jgi:SHS2 domain-containing protein